MLTCNVMNVNICWFILQKVDYITYLGTFDQLFDIPKERKTGEYRRYLIELVDYLRTFVSRIKPLMDLDADLQSAVDSMEAQFDNGMFPGWPVCYTLYIITIIPDNNKLLLVERSRLCSHQYRCSFRVVCIFQLGRVSVIRFGQT